MSLRKTLDQGLAAIKISNEFNVNAVVETLLQYIKKGNEGELTYQMYKLFNKRMEVSNNKDNIKIYQKYLETKNNLDLSKFVPVLDYDDKFISKKVIEFYSQTLQSEIKFKVPVASLFEGIPGFSLEQMDKETEKEPAKTTEKFGFNKSRASYSIVDS